MPYFTGDSEGEALDDILEDGRTVNNDKRERQAREIVKVRSLNLYEIAKATTAGSECKCPGCGGTFRKKSYQQAFCSNKGRNNCKDRYWNHASAERSLRTTIFTRRR